MRITVLALGSRGDVQPSAALGRGLKEAGHTVTLAIPPEFEPFAQRNRLGYAPIRVNIRAVMETNNLRRLVNAKANLLSFVRSILTLDLTMFKHVLADSMAASRDADLLVWHAIAPGYDIAAELGIPALMASPVPFSRTRAFSSALLPPLKLGEYLNWQSHRLIEGTLWLVNRVMWNAGHKETPGLPRLPLTSPYERMYRDQSPILYEFSPHVIPRPPDWGEHLHITGYWFLDQHDGWTPPADLLEFLEKGAPPIFAGFGSMTGGDPQAATELVLTALRMAGQRGVLVSGWGGLGKGVSGHEDVYVLDSVPHDWLFPRMSGVVHHGGAGTTGAGLRAGVPSLVLPHWGDQFFWGNRVFELGVGPKPIARTSLNAEKLAAAIAQMATDQDMRRRAAELGEKIRAEDGIGEAAKVIGSWLDTAYKKGEATRAGGFLRWAIWGKRCRQTCKPSFILGREQM